MDYFAIRHRPTNGFLPAKGKRNRGFTADDPLPLEIEAPRLFLSKHDAQVALTWWLKGISTPSYELLGDNDPEFSIVTHFIPTRFAAEMEIVILSIESITFETPHARHLKRL